MLLFGCGAGLAGGQATGAQANNSLLQLDLPATAATIRAAVADGRTGLAQLDSQGLKVGFAGMLGCPHDISRVTWG